MSDHSEKKVCTFTFKKRAKSNIQRKRRCSSDESSDNGDSNVVKTSGSKKKSLNPMIQKSGQLANRKSKVDYSSSDDEKEKLSVNYAGSKSGHREGPKDGGATATYELDTSFDRDAQAIFEKAQKLNEENKGQIDDKIYRGLNNYTMHNEKKDSAAGNASSGLVRKGPIRAPKNLRATVRWDYQPDLCKDYKETGFCGFGDSCKFMHDRGDYKHGWQLEREVESGDYFNQEDMSKYEISSDEEDIPFRCFICRDSFKNPIITKCKHYFCEKCALKQFKKSQRCFVCDANTGGVFNPAKDLMSKLDKLKSKHQSHEETVVD